MADVQTGQWRLASCPTGASTQEDFEFAPGDIVAGNLLWADHAVADGDDLRTALEAVCPDGVDVYFDNVGGPDN